MDNKTLARQISFGLIDTGVDLLLASVSLGLNLAFISPYHPRGPVRVLTDSYKLARQFKKDFLTKTGYYARKKGWLENKPGQPVLTENGLKYLSGKIPVYKKYRSWDGYLYLITYDINESSRWWRDRLRCWLNEKGAKLIQQSVWLSVTDLTQAMQKFQEDLGDNGTILVSTLNKGEGVGQEKINNLIERLYAIDALNKRYWEFIEQAKNKQLAEEEKELLKFKYLSILADDPQLPLDLLPLAWYGDRAYEHYTRLTHGRKRL